MPVSINVVHMPNNLVITMRGAFSSLIYLTLWVRIVRLFIKHRGCIQPAYISNNVGTTIRLFIKQPL